jgi:multidrug efflux pump subunit AcrB
MVSLVEALLILPAHLGGGGSFWRLAPFRVIDKIQGWTERRLERFIKGRFTNWVTRAVKFRYTTVAIAVAIFLVTIGWIAGGYMKIVFFDPVEADNMVATIVMPLGTPVNQTQQVVRKVEQAAEQIRSEVDNRRPGEPSIIKHMATTIGDQPAARGGGPVRGLAGVTDSHLAEVNIELLGSEEREGISSVDLKNRWRDIVGEIPGVSSLTFFSEIMSTGEPINVELSHQDFSVLLTAVEELKSLLREYSGVSDIADSFEEGKAELKLDLKDSGRTLGLTLSDLARQVRQGFYGEEAQRIQRGRDDIRVMVRYPEDERESLADVENMRIRLPGGTEVPFKEVAEIKYGRGYALQYRFAGEERERNESFASLLVTFPLALLAIYGLLAVQFRSYLQPLIVMSAIPFGIVGAVIGHIIMGFVFMTTFNLSLLSMLGITALAGVVVNDSLILIDLINRQRKEGVALAQIVRDSAARRFRPIMLTTLTTFFGLVPMMLERSLQARFLIPMAISLAFGVMFATLITLFLVPSLYMILEDLKTRVLPKTAELVRTLLVKIAQFVYKCFYKLYLER